MTEHRIGTVMATAGVLLSLAGAAMHVLPGPGLPVLIIGLAALAAGIVITAATRLNRPARTRPRRP
ncbi:PGPGW domain-containing protein [Streptomyces sp. NPDC006172]|uniref:PGPGW domain-containing protein n=1 Tax=Streptomyces sp. NPDC006172 TaxID=3154470 RepID=UPI00340AEA74